MTSKVTTLLFHHHLPLVWTPKRVKAIHPREVPSSSIGQFLAGDPLNIRHIDFLVGIRGTG